VAASFFWRDAYTEACVYDGLSTLNQLAGPSTLISCAPVFADDAFTIAFTDGLEEFDAVTLDSSGFIE
jgi:hypothetical protein